MLWLLKLRLLELRLMVSAGMEQGGSHATVAGGKLMELRLMVSEVDGECGDGAGKEPCHGCGVAVDGE